MKKLFLIIVLVFNLHALNNQANLKNLKNFLNQLGDTFEYKIEYKNLKCENYYNESYDDVGSYCKATDLKLTDRDGNIFLEDAKLTAEVISKDLIYIKIKDFKKPILDNITEIYVGLSLKEKKFYVTLQKPDNITVKVTFDIYHTLTEGYKIKNDKRIPIYGDENIKYLWVGAGEIYVSLSRYYLGKLDVDKVLEKFLSNFKEGTLYRKDRIILKKDLEEFKELERPSITIAYKYSLGNSLYRIIKEIKEGKAFATNIRYFEIIKKLEIDSTGYTNGMVWREDFMLNESIKRFKELGIDLVYDERTCIKICKLKNVRLIKDGEILASAREVLNHEYYEFLIFDVKFNPKFIKSLKLKSKTKKLLNEPINSIRFRISNQGLHWPENLCRISIDFRIDDKVSIDYYLKLLHKGSMQDCITDFITKQGDFKLKIELFEFQKNVPEALDFLKNYPIINDKKVYEEALKNVFKP